MNRNSLAYVAVVVATVGLAASRGLSVAPDGASATIGDAAKREATTASLELKLRSGESKVAEVALGQSAREILARLQPAAAAADDDPWLLYPAKDGGHYALFFSAEGTVQEMRSRADAARGRDKLHAVVHYPGEPQAGGAYLLPERLRDSTAGEFVTLKVRLSSEQARAATVTLGMSQKDVVRLYHTAEDRAQDEGAIVFDSIDDGGRYLLLFSSGDEGRQQSALSHVVYWPSGGKPLYILPQAKRGEPVPDDLGPLMSDRGAAPAR